MEAVTTFYTTHPFWVWMAVAAVVLGVEIATGSGYLLWPAASAAVMAVLSLFRLDLGVPIELAIFAFLTIATTLTAKRYLPRGIHGTNPDINDPMLRLVGRHGRATTSFADGRGRVDVDGKDWAAELDAGYALEDGARVEVIGVVDGARLSVRPA